ncbi:MAG: hypothetical protein CMN30_00050 [Sandaracinus sp.]|nr:hypothetical protein [Sandaracinus sp.]
MDDDLPVADVLAASLRDLGAEVALVGASGRGAELVGSLDPEIVLVEESVGDVDPLRAKLMSNPRLRWARVLAFRAKEVFPRGNPVAAGVPADGLFGHRLAALGERVATALAPERACRRAASQLARFEVDISELGPVRTLRALMDAEAPGVLRLQVTSGTRRCILEVAGEQLMGCVSMESEGGAPQEGLPALARFLELDDGDAKVERRSEASRSNVVKPVLESVARAADLLSDQATHRFAALGQHSLSTVHRDLSELADATREPEESAPATDAGPTGRYPSIFDDDSQERTLPSVPPPKLLDEATRPDDADVPADGAPAPDATRLAKPKAARTMLGLGLPKPAKLPEGLEMPRRVKPGGPKPPLDPRPAKKFTIPEPPPRPASSSVQRPDSSAAKRPPAPPKPVSSSVERPASSAAKRPPAPPKPVPSAERPVSSSAKRPLSSSVERPLAPPPPAPGARPTTKKKLQATMMGFPQRAPQGRVSEPPTVDAPEDLSLEAPTVRPPEGLEVPAEATPTPPPKAPARTTPAPQSPPAAPAADAFAATAVAGVPAFDLDDDPLPVAPAAPRITPDPVPPAAPQLSAPPSSGSHQTKGSAARIWLPALLLVAAAAVIGVLLIRQGESTPVATSLPPEPGAQPTTESTPSPEPEAAAASAETPEAEDPALDGDAAETEVPEAEATAEPEAAAAASEPEALEESSPTEVDGVPSLAALPPVPVPFLPDAREAGHDREESEALRDAAGDHSGEARLRYLAASASADRGNPHVVAEIAEYYSEAGEHALAEAWAREAVRLRRRRASYRELLGDVLAAAGKPGPARAAWQEAVELDPDSPAAARLR